MTEKPTNPKTSVGIRKWRYFTTVPLTVLAEVGVAMLEGARKYGRHNYRESGVLASVYTDAAIGHIMQWWEGEDLDPDTKLSHITKAIASLVVLRDAMIQEQLSDDRPPKAKLDRVRAEMQQVVDAMFDKYPEPKPAHVARGESAKIEAEELVSGIMAERGTLAPLQWGKSRRSAAEYSTNDEEYWIRRNAYETTYAVGCTDGIISLDCRTIDDAMQAAQAHFNAKVLSNIRGTQSNVVTLAVDDGIAFCNEPDPAPAATGDVVHGSYTPGQTVAGIAEPDEKLHVGALGVAVFHPTQVDL